MATTAQSVRTRKDKARTEFSSLMEKDFDNIFVIHYSCESFLFKPVGTVSRIAAVAVRNLSGKTRKVFTINSAAAAISCDEKDIPAKLSELEKNFLTELFSFFSAHQNASWIHWNMNTDKYGFDALKLRHDQLNSQAGSLPEMSSRFNLAAHLKNRLGTNYGVSPIWETVG